MSIDCTCIYFISHMLCQCKHQDIKNQAENFGSVTFLRQEKKGEGSIRAVVRRCGSRINFRGRQSKPAAMARRLRGLVRTKQIYPQFLMDHDSSSDRFCSAGDVSSSSRLRSALKFFVARFCHERRRLPPFPRSYESTFPHCPRED